jgi:hypothetical protein
MRRKLLPVFRLFFVTASLLFVAATARSANSIQCPLDNACATRGAVCVNQGWMECSCPSGQTPVCLNNGDGGDFCMSREGLQYICGDSFSCICE